MLLPCRITTLKTRSPALPAAPARTSEDYQGDSGRTVSVADVSTNGPEHPWLGVDRDLELFIRPTIEVDEHWARSGPSISPHDVREGVECRWIDHDDGLRRVARVKRPGGVRVPISQETERRQDSGQQPKCDALGKSTNGRDGPWNRRRVPSYGYSPTTSDLTHVTNADRTSKNVTYTAQGSLATLNDENHSTGSDYAWVVNGRGKTEARCGLPLAPTS